ncbi:hypothetical protein J7M23_06860 [Candidatus Sumerlaeota bacterium]|nr:hypothetical protein [Candidatus Sumerlaeota bacterium]
MKATAPILYIIAFCAALIIASQIGSAAYEGILTLLAGPEYCYHETQDLLTELGAKGISISRRDTSTNQLCFRTKDTSFVLQLNQQIEQRKLEQYRIQQETERQFWEKLLRPEIIISILLAIAIIALIIIAFKSGSF